MSAFDVESYFRAEHAELKTVVDASYTKIAEPFHRLVKLSAKSLAAGGKIMFFGNGGSASDAQHFAAELIVKYGKDRAPIAAIALNTDTSVLTALVNDYGMEHLFARQILGLGKKGDVVVGMSTSGNSANIVKAMETAKEMGITPAAFAGGTGGKLVGLCDPLMIVASTNTARIQEMHTFLGQCLCGAVERELGLV